MVCRAAPVLLPVLVGAEAIAAVGEREHGSRPYEWVQDIVLNRRFRRAAIWRAVPRKAASQLCPEVPNP